MQTDQYSERSYRLPLPTVIVSGQSNAGIAQPQFLGQADLRDSCHIHHLTAPAPEQEALCSRGKPRSFDGHHRPLTVETDSHTLSRSGEN